MKITICGSSTFKEQMIQYRDQLNELGHEAIVHPNYEQFVKGELQELWARVEREHAKVKQEQDYIRWYHDRIVESDAILVLNFEKRGVQNYIGGNTLMEIGFAYINRKKIFMTNDIPELSYADEIEAMSPIIIGEDLSKII